MAAATKRSTSPCGVTTSMSSPSQQRASGNDVLLSLQGLSKTFGGKTVLKDVDLELRSGEIHGLIGANGSGKSTLVKLLSGFHVPDPGAHVEVCGQEVGFPIDPSTVGGLSLEFVHQDLALWDSGTVAENFSIIHHTTHFGWRLSLSEERERVSQALVRFNLDIPGDRLVKDLTAVERSLLAIVRAVEGFLSEKRGVLVLDEPTAALARDTTEPLFDLLRELAAQGVAILFVSHRLDEIRELTDRVTVLRDGEVVSVENTRSIREDELIERLLGFRMSAFYPDSRPNDVGDVVLEVESLQGVILKGVDLSVRAGEVLGLAGTEGMGHEELPYLIFGAQAATRGRVKVGSAELDVRSLTPRHAIEAGLGLLPAHRIRDSGVLKATAEENVTLPGLFRQSAMSVVRSEVLRAEVAELMEQYQVVPPEPQRELSTFSGGNQQKLLFAKWFRLNPSVMLLHEPTQGVDVGAKRQIFRVIDDAARMGMAVVIASGEYEDLAHLCTRVLVFRDGRIAAELGGSALTYREILSQCLVSAA